MSKKDGSADTAAARAWTHIEDYVGAMIRQRESRRRRRVRPRTQPEAPRPLLSTVPFLILIAALAVLAVAIGIAAFPGRDHRPARQQEREIGTAPSGWFEDSKREMR